MGDSPSDKIDARVEELGGWRGDALALVRKLIKKADPDVTEEWKWRGGPELVSRRDDLHRGNIQRQGQGDLREGRIAGRPGATV